MSTSKKDNPTESLEVAVIGMEGRFPGAGNIDEFWRNLRDGVESIRLFTDETMKGFGVSPADLASPDFVKAGALLEGADLFDASFFGYSPREAELLDPQQRVFLECAWSALENAAYNPETYPGLIGVFAGASMSSYLLYNISARSVSPEDGFQVMIGNDKDFLSTRVSYELNLKGPSINVQTACSTSLVAIHLACQSLLSYQCDMALAGGISIQVPQRTGYYYQEGGITSPDGHCRAFDAKAQGTVFGSGVGIVVLKRLADALEDSDTIHAIIKGSAINNDGSLKVGYTAPSVEGQAQVIMMAQLLSNVTPEMVTYIEAHGTGTPLGDPVEIEALTRAFRSATQANRFCAIGSVKTNIGHLDAAAGVAGLIKTILSLKHKQLPASLHFLEANPAIDFDSSPFYVNAELREWERETEPRRAGVSSFGVGGTNAHVVLEEGPEQERAEGGREWEVMVMSARTEGALERMTENLVEYLKREERETVRDVSYTLRVGRKRFEQRRVVVCRDEEEAIEILEKREGKGVYSVKREAESRPVIFMFPGGGAQYAGMGHGVYRSEKAFREQVGLCAEILEPRLGYDLREFIFPEAERVEAVSQLLNQTSVALPALFVIEYALARLWMSWGIHPEGMIGHSLGEYVAACLAGVFSLEDALSLVVLRGELLERLPAGTMISVPLSEVEASALIDERFSIAAINGPAQCVISGPVNAMDEMAGLLTSKSIEFRRLQINVASHSPLVTPILQEFTASIAKLRLRAPTIPYLSNVTGTWASDEVTDPAYWARHLRQTVRFAEGVSELLSDPERVLLEVGPGHTLSTLARLQNDNNHSRSILSSLRHPYDQQADMAFLLTTLGKLWAEGVEIDWQEYDKANRRRRVPLPTYPFERERYWIEAKSGLQPKEPDSLSKNNLIDEWFYVPVWKSGLEPEVKPAAELTAKENEAGGKPQRWLILADEEGIGDELAERRRRAGQQAVVVRAGRKYERRSEHEYVIDVERKQDYEEMVRELGREGGIGRQVVHLYGMKRLREEGAARFEEAAKRGYYSVMYLVQAIRREANQEEVGVTVVTAGMQEVESWEEGEIEKVTALGFGKVSGQEEERIRSRSIDVVMRGEEGEKEKIARQVEREIEEGREEEVAYRGRQRWVKSYERAKVGSGASGLKEGGVYLISGGMGKIGLMLARFLSMEVKAHVILVGRSEFPQKNGWEEWLREKGEGDEVSKKIKKLMEMESGVETEIKIADVCDEEQMRGVIDEIYERHGRLNGVIHAAGAAGEKVFRLIPEMDDEESRSQFKSKVYGLYVLQKILQGREVDFCMLFSSNASILGGIGLSGYSSANLFMDAFAASRRRKEGKPWISVNWDGWLLADEDRLAGAFRTSMDQYAMTPAESLESFKRVASLSACGQVIVSTGNLFNRLDLWIKNRGAERSLNSKRGGPVKPHARPALEIDYVPPSDEIQMTIAKIWQEQLGIDCLGINDNFFELGGNSLIGLKVVSLLKKELGVEIPIIALFEGPTVSALAQVISSHGNAGASYEENISRGERRRARRLRKPSAASGSPNGD